MVTLKKIAEEVGVQESTVSRILNRKDSSIKFSEATVKKVERAAQALGYQPNATARALATKRSGYIGFILSDKVQGGWGNMYFAQHLSGIERACRRLGYGLNICLYNLSNLEDFVFPASVGQRSVDGVVLCGYTDPSVVKLFCKAKIPTISIGNNIDCSDIVPTVAVDKVGGYLKVARYCAGIGHRRLLFCNSGSKGSQMNTADFASRLKDDPVAGNIILDTFIPPHGLPDYSAAETLFQHWKNLPGNKKPSVILGSDQTMIAMTRELASHGIKCPEEVSLVSGSDTQMCQFSNPSLTALYYDIEALAETAVTILVDHLDKGKTMDSHICKNNFDGVIVERESCKPILT